MKRLISPTRSDQDQSHRQHEKKIKLDSTNTFNQLFNSDRVCISILSFLSTRDVFQQLILVLDRNTMERCKQCIYSMTTSYSFPLLMEVEDPTIAVYQPSTLTEEDEENGCEAAESVVTLDESYCDREDKRIISILNEHLKHLHNLTSLDFSNCNMMGEQSFKTLSMLQSVGSFQKLSQIDLSCASCLTAQTVATLPHSDRIVNLSLEGCGSLGGVKDLIALIYKFPNLTHLNLNDVLEEVQVTNSTISLIDTLVATCKELKVLSLRGLKLNEKFSTLTKLDHLEKLALSYSDISDEDLMLLTKYFSSKLQVLELAHCSSLGREGIASIKQMSVLHTLDLSENRIVDDELLDQCLPSQLAKLFLTDCTQLTAKCLQSNHLNQLSLLDITACEKITSLSTLSDLVNLKNIAMSIHGGDLKETDRLPPNIENLQLHIIVHAPNTSFKGQLLVEELKQLRSLKRVEIFTTALLSNRDTFKELLIESLPHIAPSQIVL